MKKKRKKSSLYTINKSDAKSTGKEKLKNKMFECPLFLSPPSPPLIFLDGRLITLFKDIFTSL